MDDISFRLFSSSGLLDSRDTLYPYDSITEEEVIKNLPSVQDYEAELLLIKRFCAWDSGHWKFEDESRNGIRYKSKPR